MLVNIVSHCVSESFELRSDNFNLLWWEVNVDCKASFLAIFDAKFLQTLLDRVLGVHKVDNFIAQALSLHLVISFRNQSPRYGNVQMHDTGDVACVDNCEIILVCLSE